MENKAKINPIGLTKSLFKLNNDKIKILEEEVKKIKAILKQHNLIIKEII